MKNLTEILTKEQLDWFDQILLEHISIDLPCALMMCETRGLYDGLEELVEKIYKDVVTASKKSSGIVNLEYDKKDFQGFHNIFYYGFFLV